MDLIERLRLRQEPNCIPTDDLCQEAAAELTRLRSEVEGARAKALEEAAAVCDRKAGISSFEMARGAYQSAARAIRELVTNHSLTAKTP